FFQAEDAIRDFHVTGVQTCALPIYMSEQTTSSGNKNVVLICGEPNTGQSTSLMNLTTQDRMAYLNCDLKELPFRSKFAVNVEVRSEERRVGKEWRVRR